VKRAQAKQVNPPFFEGYKFAYNLVNAGCFDDLSDDFLTYQIEW